MNDALDRIKEGFVRCWPKAEDRIFEYLTPMIVTYAQSECADDHYLNEFASGDLNKLMSRIWEAMLYARFRGQGWDVSSSNDGPDFRLKTPDGCFVEAVCATPGDPDRNGLPREWQEKKDGVAVRIPYDQMTLRWTSALKEKNERFQDYAKGNAEIPNSPFVIAVNSSRLGPDECGINGIPLAVMAVLPLAGGLETLEDVKTGEIIDGPRPAFRDTIINANCSPVQTDNFLNPDYANVSALIGCSSFYVDEEYRSKFCGQPRYCVVHNPLATNALPQPWLPGATEYAIVDGALVELE